MKKISYVLCFNIIFLCINFIFPAFAQQPNPIKFWNTQQKGTNFFNLLETKERYIEAKKLGLSFVRLSPNKWASVNKDNSQSKTNSGNFLIGTLNSPNIIPPKEDVAELIKVLNYAQAENIKIILTMISLPYSRWSQHNNSIEDRRIWEDFKYQNEIIDFWINLYKQINNHPAIAGINIRNEPSPELAKKGIRFNDWYSENYLTWYEKVKGTPQDLNLFNKKIVAEIRKINKTVPIVLESGYYATPWAFKILEPIYGDDNILYSFHMYEPYIFTSNKDSSIKYPNVDVAIGEKNWETTKTISNKNVIKWNKQELVNFLSPIQDFQKKYNIPSNRIIVSEFGIRRQNTGAKKYLEDLISIFNENKWHWAFYSFREDNWDAMDYELGTKKSPYSYWQSIENGEMPDYSKIKDQSLINVIKEGLNK